MITARAHANIALVKYWGKRDAALNLPAAGSLSLTLEALTTTASVAPVDGPTDVLRVDGRPADAAAQARFSAWADLVRARAGCDVRFAADSANDFPTSSGLASSASAYAALALATSRAAGLALSPRELSVLARRGSGSAARSIHGGLVELRAGERSDGEDCAAEPLLAADELARAWPIAMVVAVVGGGAPKDRSSRSAMAHGAATSPLHDAWLATVPGDLAAARAAIARRDLAALGEVAEASALAMHGAILAARPAICYFHPATIALMDAVRDLRRRGASAYFTIDAGPHVKVLTTAAEAPEISRALAAVPDVTRVIVSAPGGPAQLVGDP